MDGWRRHPAHASQAAQAMKNSAGPIG